MNQQTRERVAWQCPLCGKRFRIPKGRSPSACRECAQSASAGQPRELAVPTLDAPASEPPVLDPVPDIGSIPAPPPPPEQTLLPAEVEAHIARQEREQLLKDVANISRTMTFFRRLMWGMAALMLLNVIFVGAAFYYSMQQFSDIHGLFQEKDSPLPRGQMQQIQQHMGNINELLEDLQNN